VNTRALPLRIAFDLDGVFADMDAELARQAEVLFGEAMIRRLQEPTAAPAAVDKSAPAPVDSAAKEPDNTPPLKLHMTSRQQRKLWQHVETIKNFWQSLKEIEPGSIERLAAIAAERRWEIIFLTKRPRSAGASSQLQSQRWLESKGFPLPSVYVVQGSRGRIAAALGLDIVVDDTPENCLDVVMDSTARAILVCRDDETHVTATANRLGIGLVKSVDDCLKILVQMANPIEVALNASVS
jgi:hypothetical protein